MKLASFVSCLVVLAACGSCEEAPAPMEGAPSAGATLEPAAPAPEPTAPVGARGPFPSIEAYCATVLEGLGPQSCEGPTEEDANVCRCERASGPTITGPASARGPGAPVDEVALVAVQTLADVDCRLALLTTNGVYVVEDVATCGASPMAHDSGHSLTTRTLSATRAGEAVEVVFEWEESTESAPDVDSEEQEWTRESAGQFRVACTVDSAGSVRCNPRETTSATATGGASAAGGSLTPCRVELEHRFRDPARGDAWSDVRVPVTTIRALTDFERERYDVSDWTRSPIAPRPMTRAEAQAFPNVAEHEGKLTVPLEDSSSTWTFDEAGRATLADVDPVADSSVYRFHYTYECAE